MEANFGISKETKLYRLGEKLFKAALKYYSEYVKTVDPCPVVWITNEEGTMVIFCHEMYGKQLLTNAGIINQGTYNHKISFFKEGE